jgi:alpha-galactosidase
VTRLDGSAELWAPGASQPSLSGVDVPGFDALQVSSSDASATTVEVSEGVVRIRLAAGPGTRMLTATVPSRDAVALWRPGSASNRSGLAPSWEPAEEFGPFTGTFMGCLVQRDGRSGMSFGAFAGDATVRGRSGMVEETAELLVVVETDEPEDLVLVLVTEQVDFADAVGALGRELGLRRAPVDARNLQPVLCTWYSFHQNLQRDAVIEEARRAAELGFGTIIVDDGWQNADADRGYGTCGDWRINTAKVGDGRGFVSELQAAGLNVLWWIGTPFIGYRSDAYASGEFTMLHDETGMDAAILDPRTSAGALTRRLGDLIRDTGADGLKLDFLERFAVGAGADEGSGQQHAALEMLDQISSTIRGASEDPMIEYREPYLSRATISRATMIRVGDCPLSPTLNRLGVLDLRLVTRGIAVHSDPVMWSRNDSPERVAQHLLSALFGVPQVSVRFDGMSAEHHATLAHWIGFWNEHASLLLGESLRVVGVEEDYALAHVQDGDTAISVRYAGAGCVWPDGDWSTWHIVNAGAFGVHLEGAPGEPVDIEIFDSCGHLTQRASRPLALLDRLDIPTGGRAELRRMVARAS